MYFNIYFYLKETLGPENKTLQCEESSNEKNRYEKLAASTQLGSVRKSSALSLVFSISL